MIETSGLTKEEQGVKILDQIDLEVHEGQSLAIMGSARSGKSTLVKCLATLSDPTSGAVRLFNTNLKNLSQDDLSFLRQEKISFLFQKDNLLQALTAYDNIALPLRILNKWSPQEIDEKIKKYATALGIAELLNFYPSQLSLPQQQFVALVRALIKKSDLLIVDEPTAGLNPSQAYELLSLLVAVNEELGTTILMVTQDFLAASFFKQMIYLKNGRIQQRHYKKKNQSYAAYYESLVGRQKQLQSEEFQ